MLRKIVVVSLLGALSVSLQSLANVAPVEDLSPTPVIEQHSHEALQSSQGGYDQVSAEINDASMNATQAGSDQPIDATPQTVELVNQAGPAEASADPGQAAQYQVISDLQREVQQLRAAMNSQERALKKLTEQQNALAAELTHARQAKKTVTESRKPAVKSEETRAVQAIAVSHESAPAAPSDATAYNQAFTLLRGKKYAAASTAFQQYLQQFPKGEFRVSAYYWLGEINLQQRQPKLALAQFEKMVQLFPKSNKVPDAKLKIAIIHMSLGKAEQAKGELINIKKQYPGTTAAQLATLQLQQLGSTH